MLDNGSGLKVQTQTRELESGLNSLLSSQKG